MTGEGPTVISVGRAAHLSWRQPFNEVAAMKVAIVALALVLLSAQAHSNTFDGYPDWAKQAFTSKGSGR
jgi:hypothetical protein